MKTLSASLQFAQGLLISMYIVCAPPRHRGIFVVSTIAIVILCIGLIDRGIEVGRSWLVS